MQTSTFPDWDRGCLLFLSVLDGEVIVDKQRIMLGMLAPRGIVKGKPFAPNARQAAILEEVVSIGSAEMNVAFFANPRPERIVWEGRHWEWLPVSGPVNPDTLEFGTKDYRDLLASDHFYFAGWGMSAAIGRREVGPGSIYFTALKDSTGTYLDGGANYALSIPGIEPANLNNLKDCKRIKPTHHNWQSLLAEKLIIENDSQDRHTLCSSVQRTQPCATYFLPYLSFSPCLCWQLTIRNPAVKVPLTPITMW